MSKNYVQATTFVLKDAIHFVAQKGNLSLFFEPHPSIHTDKLTDKLTDRIERYDP